MIQHEFLKYPTELLKKAEDPTTLRVSPLALVLSSCLALCLALHGNTHLLTLVLATYLASSLACHFYFQGRFFLTRSEKFPFNK
jgi:hypothetical protein